MNNIESLVEEHKSTKRDADTVPSNGDGDRDRARQDSNLRGQSPHDF